MTYTMTTNSFLTWLTGAAANTTVHKYEEWQFALFLDRLGLCPCYSEVFADFFF